MHNVEGQLTGPQERFIDSECEAAAELWAAGVDEKRREATSRALVRLRCIPAGHRLGAVYRTSYGYGLLRARQEPPSAGLFAEISARGLRDELRSDGPRDRWIIACEWFRDAHGRVLPSWFEPFVLLDADNPFDGDAPIPVWCRCGTRAGPRPSELVKTAQEQAATRRRKPVTLCF